MSAHPCNIQQRFLLTVHRRRAGEGPAQQHRNPTGSCSQEALLCLQSSGHMHHVTMVILALPIQQDCRLGSPVWPKHTEQGSPAAPLWRPGEQRGRRWSSPPPHSAPLLRPACPPVWNQVCLRRGWALATEHYEDRNAYSRCMLCVDASSSRCSSLQHVWTTSAASCCRPSLLGINPND